MKYKVLKPIMYHGKVITDGEIELDKEQAERLLELEAVEEPKKKRGSGDDQADTAQ